MPNSRGGSEKRCCGGMRPCSSASSTWISETTPAAQPVWPTSDLFDVTYTGRSPLSFSRRLWNSARSPAGVPVACATTQSTASLRTSVCRYARSIAMLWPAEFGA
ncbi:hypothetical protein X948_5351 [Burkholderia pseudomallei MSHR5608]|nr:hypothetical protein X948_5351 [Burkholderia pseudomallei MSHR5608]